MKGKRHPTCGLDSESNPGHSGERRACYHGATNKSMVKPALKAKGYSCSTHSIASYQCTQRGNFRIRYLETNLFNISNLLDLFNRLFLLMSINSNLQYISICNKISGQCGRIDLDKNETIHFCTHHFYDFFNKTLSKR